ncbi:MAG: TetR/AcrR family transcriptional regulator [Chloroflexota bacterium]
MSPARARTSDEAVIAAARRLLEEGGLEAVTMAAVAAKVGIRPPSLYKRFADRQALIRAIGIDVFAELGEALRGAETDPGADRSAPRLRAMARAYRQFGRSHPAAYGLLFTNLTADARPPVEAGAAATAPVLDVVGSLVGPKDALDATRLVAAFCHGFVSMELAGAFRLGGDLDEAFGSAIDRLLESLSARQAS